MRPIVTRRCLLVSEERRTSEHGPNDGVSAVSRVRSCAQQPSISGPVTHVPTMSTQSEHVSGIWELVVHACSSRMLQAPGAGGDIDESDQCCQVVEGDVREMVAPQWEGWVGGCQQPSAAEGSCVKCDMLKPTDASTDSQLWWNPVHRPDDELCLSCGCVVLPAPISLLSCLRRFLILVCLPVFLYGPCFDTPSEKMVCFSKFLKWTQKLVPSGRRGHISMKIEAAPFNLLTL